MTPEEAIDYLLNYGGLLPSDSEEPLRMAIEALGKADKYRWHDLRKDPEDLPIRSGQYLVLMFARGNSIWGIKDRYYYEVAQWEMFDSKWFCSDRNNIIKWSEINKEPFEESEE